MPLKKHAFPEKNFKAAAGKLLERFYTKEQADMSVWNRAKEIMPYTSCQIEEGKYTFFFDSRDKGISDLMFQKKKIFEGKELNLFFRLTKKYYGYTPNDKKTVFLDIGANIGTMSIAAKEKYHSLKVVGFEPGSENAKLFKINTIVNNKEDIQVCNIAISDFDGNADLFINESSCVEHILMMDKYRDTSKRATEQVKVMKLDSWCEQNRLPMDRVGYICLDVEGHENAVLEGATKLLSDHAIPLWLEISSELSKNGSADLLIKNISKFYDSYIDKRRPHIVNEIGKLKELIQDFENNNSHTDIFLIK